MFASPLQGDGGQGHTRSTTTSHRLAKEADKEKERNGNGKKMVTMAPVSRCMSSTGQYVARRPLVSTERHTSILKNPLSQELTTQVKEVIYSQVIFFIVKFFFLDFILIDNIFTVN